MELEADNAGITEILEQSKYTCNYSGVVSFSDHSFVNDTQKSNVLQCN